MLIGAIAIQWCARLTSVCRPGAVDCNALLVDDDGTGYIAFTAEAPGPGLSNHRVAIEKLTPDFTGTTKKRMGPTPSFLFPHDYVEGPMLWKRKGKYYVSYGSCCCFCRAGSGNIVLSAPSINGPWTTQREDTNCVTDSAANTSVCGGYGAGNTPFGRPEVNGRMTINAQGIGEPTPASLVLMHACRATARSLSSSSMGRCGWPPSSRRCTQPHHTHIYRWPPDAATQDLLGF